MISAISFFADTPCIIEFRSLYILLFSRMFYIFQLTEQKQTAILHNSRLQAAIIIEHYCHDYRLYSNKFKYFKFEGNTKAEFIRLK